MRRVAVTGMGIVSCIGNTLDEVTRSLRSGRSGLSASADFARVGLKSQVVGVPDLSALAPIERKLRRFMGKTAAYAYHAMKAAVGDSGLTREQVSDPRSGLIVGSGVGSISSLVAAIDLLREKGPAKVPPYLVPQVMSSTASACLGTAFNIKGISYSVTSACASSAHCIGHGMELIQQGRQDIVFAGGADEESWELAALFDAMGTLSSAFNDRPDRASRPYDRARDGFVLAGGAAVLVLEELEHARRRGAQIYGEVVGYGACSDGADMVSPSPEGAARTMRLALEAVDGDIDYVNTHGTSTPLGDLVEVEAMRDVFGASMPLFSSTKSLTGHALGAAGAMEALFCLLMLKRGFVAGSANVDELDPALAGLPLIRESREHSPRTILSNSFGFGGTNATLILRRLEDGYQ